MELPNGLSPISFIDREVQGFRSDTSNINPYLIYSNIKYISAIITTQIATIISIPNNTGNVTINNTNITSIKNIPIAFNSIMGLIPQSSSLPYKF